MGDEYTVGDADGLSPAVAMVRDAVARELNAQLPLRNQAIRHEDIVGVAYAVAVHLDHMRLVAPPIDAPDRYDDAGRRSSQTVARITRTSSRARRTGMS